MFLEVVGSDGSKQAGSNLVTMRLGRSVLIDTGSASSLTNTDQMDAELVLLTHAHLDHVLELGFLIDAIASQRGTPLRVMGSPACLAIVKTHYMNDLIWPDFSGISTVYGPALEYSELVDGEWMELAGGVDAMPVPVNHGAGGRGFLFRSDRGSVVYTGDTGPTDDIWKAAAGLDNLTAIVAEVSFPDRLRNVALASDHLSPGLLSDEMAKLGRDEVPIYAFHLKPWFRHEIERDLARSFGERTVLLFRGDRLEF
jgi:cAMP phosphodiesterase